MVRGAAIALILTFFMQVNMGSIFGQFSSQERQDKAQMLKHMRGILNPDLTTVKAGVNKREEAWIPSSPKPVLQRLWKNNPLPVSSSRGLDKSKLLAQLRGMTSEPEPIIPNQNAEEVKAREIQNAFVSVEQSESEESDQPSRLMWERPTKSRRTFMEPIKKETDSGTCYWHGQQQDHVEHDMDGRRVALKKNQEIGIENWEDHVEEWWKCVTTKFWISYDKIKKKVCGMFGVS